jgi:hypothetical protein
MDAKLISIDTDTGVELCGKCYFLLVKIDASPVMAIIVGAIDALG